MFLLLTMKPYTCVGDGISLSPIVFARASGGGFLKFKNGFQWDRETANSRYNLRLVLATVGFSHPQLPTIGLLRNNDQVWFHGYCGETS